MKLPDEVQVARDSLQNYFDNTVHPSRPYGEYCALMDDLQTLDAHIATQAARIAELEADAEKKKILRGEIHMLRNANATLRDGKNKAEKALADNSELLTIAHMDGYHKGEKTGRGEQRELTLKAEATLARIMEWAKGRCECCEHWKDHRVLDAIWVTSKFCMKKLHRQECNWAPPAAWGIGGVK